MKMQFLPRFFEENGGMLTAGQLTQAGFTHYQLNRLLERGEVARLKQGLYKWIAAEADAGQSELPELARMIPHGVVCLLTACQHHGLGSFVSSWYDVAIPGKSKVVLPEYPPVRLYYWQTAAYHTGIDEILVDGTPVRIYDAEKTVCDMVRLRGRIGADTAKQVEKAYLQRKERDLAKLFAYARALGIENLVRERMSLLA